MDGCWNIYAFDNYRQNMRVEEVARVSNIATNSLASRTSLSADISLAGLAGCALPLEIGISAVIEAAGGELSYFALSHFREVPDFHLRQGFAIVLTAC